jgi:cytosine/adenosine deaminase-related metal-dependent hydrolase
MRLGSGIAPLSTLHSRGVSVVLGTDGAASNDGQNIFETLKSAVLLQRVADINPQNWLTAREALSLVTSNPARVFGFGTGRISFGAPADFIAIRRSGHSFSPLHDWHRQLVFGATGLEVRYAVVAGKLILDDGRITTFDEDAILAEAREIAPSLFGKLGNVVQE